MTSSGLRPVALWPPLSSLRTEAAGFEPSWKVVVQCSPWSVERAKMMSAASI
jgi:hypothetical protein